MGEKTTAREILLAVAGEYPELGPAAATTERLDTTLIEKELRERYMRLCKQIAWQQVEGYEGGKREIKAGNVMMYFYADALVTLIQPWRGGRMPDPDPRKAIKTHSTRRAWVESSVSVVEEFWVWESWLRRQAKAVDGLRGVVAVSCAVRRFKTRPLRVVQVLSRELSAMERADRALFPNAWRPDVWELRDVPTRGRARAGAR